MPCRLIFGMEQHRDTVAVDRRIAELATRQHGLPQLLALGLRHGAIAHRVREGRLHRLHRGVRPGSLERAVERSLILRLVYLNAINARHPTRKAFLRDLCQALRRPAINHVVIAPA